MKTYIYNITIDTPLGLRHGRMTRFSDNNTEKGYIEILGKRNKFTAKIESNGKCCISGKLKTLIRDFEFEGNGYIWPDKLNIILYSGKKSYTMNGVLKEENSDEKIL